MAFARPCPPPVQQANVWWCWAACLEILNRAHPNKFPAPIRTQQQWVSELQTVDTEHRLLNSQGGINVHYLPAVLNQIGMTGHLFQPNNPFNQQTFQQNIALIEEKLQISYLLAVFPVAGGSHFVIIYGIDANNIYFFNPWAQLGKQTVTHQQAQSNRFIIAWKP